MPPKHEIFTNRTINGFVAWMELGGIQDMDAVSARETPSGLRFSNK
jgi:hypothetical protein